MSCDQIRAQLDAFVEGEVTRPDRVAVTTHLATCESCRQQADAAEQMAGLLYQLPRQPAPDGLPDRILAAVEAQRRPAPAWSPRTVMIAAGSLVAGLIAVWLAFETVVAAQEGGVIDFLTLLTSRPQTLLAYPQDALYALLEAIPVTELVLTLGMALIALVLLNQVLTALGDHRLPNRLGNGAA
jgi:anti-sigma factor (TIGR02949 family)